MSTATTEEKHDTHHDLPLKEAFIALLIFTVIEVLIAEFTEHSPMITTLLLILTALKMLVIGSVFMEIAFDKETTRIVLYVFVIPFLTALFLILAIVSDWRQVIGL